MATVVQLAGFSKARVDRAVAIGIGEDLVAIGRGNRAGNERRRAHDLIEQLDGTDPCGSVTLAVMVVVSVEVGCWGEWSTCRICGPAVVAATVLTAPGVGWRASCRPGVSVRDRSRSRCCQGGLKTCTAMVFTPSTRKVAALVIDTSYHNPSVA